MKLKSFTKRKVLDMTRLRDAKTGTRDHVLVHIVPSPLSDRVKHV